jgi:hypothetical protein
VDELQSITGSVYGVGSTHLMNLTQCRKRQSDIYMYDIILYAADSHQRERDLFKNEFYRLADWYRPKTKSISEKACQQYNKLVTQGSMLSKHL